MSQYSSHAVRLLRDRLDVLPTELRTKVTRGELTLDQAERVARTNRQRTENA